MKLDPCCRGGAVSAALVISICLLCGGVAAAKGTVRRSYVGSSIGKLVASRS
jgi:hypothetical protein